MAKLDTFLTRKLGIEHPVVCGGMHYVGYAKLAASVSNAGGLGFITALTQPSADELKKEIRLCKTLTDKPFGVNFTLLPALVPPNYQAYADVIISEGVKIVETAGNKPSKWIQYFKKNDIFVIHKCVNIRHAKRAQKDGADLISIDGFECAGHPGTETIGNFLLLALAAKKLNIPFIASGGVGSGKQLAAALVLGAEGVNCGTLFMSSTEANIHPNIKQALIDYDETNTTHIFESLNFHERVFKNKTALKVREIEKKYPGDFSKIRHLVSGAAYKKSFQQTGNINDSCWSCGPVIGLIDEIRNCKEIINSLVTEAISVIEKTSTKVIKSNL